MVRPREFDRDQALLEAMHVFWSKGFAATSTDDLLKAMGIGRQSMYNAFGDKRQLYLEALGHYMRTTTAAHLARLNSADSALDGIFELLNGLAAEGDRNVRLGCMGVCSAIEFGPSDEQVNQLRQRATEQVSSRLCERIAAGQATGEIATDMSAAQAASFVQLAMNGLQLAARAGVEPSELTQQKHFVVDRLRTA
jgi:AcrR family transcriptional regulator